MSKYLDKIAIRTILKHTGGSATYAEIALRGGNGLASPLMEMVQDGEIIKEYNEDRPFGFQTLYHLKDEDYD